MALCPSAAQYDAALVQPAVRVGRGASSPRNLGPTKGLRVDLLPELESPGRELERLAAREVELVRGHRSPPRISPPIMALGRPTALLQVGLEQPAD
eukprot:6171447-Pyramimonas_sp.AAC.1